MLKGLQFPFNNNSLIHFKAVMLTKEASNARPFTYVQDDSPIKKTMIILNLPASCE